jgi:type IV pilus assembly protein PilB
MSHRGIENYMGLNGNHTGPAPRKDMRLGEILVAAGILDVEQINQALLEQKDCHGKRLGEILVDKHLIDHETLALGLALRHKLPYLELRTYPINPKAVDCVSSKLAKKYNFVPIDFQNRQLVIAIAEPLALDVLKDIEFHSGLKTKVVMCSSQAIKKCIQEHYQEFTDSFLNEVEVENVETNEYEHDISEETGREQPVINLVNHILKQGIEKNASDIHIRPGPKTFDVVYRIDGHLFEEKSFPIKLLKSVTVRLKIISNMDIAERRLPQDGKARIKLRNRNIDLRFSCMPTVYGESTVVRIFDKNARPLDLDAIGFFHEDLEAIRSCIRKPYGMVLITGPTGSGKSSTIYSCIREPVFDGKNIISLEDPVEVEIPGITQVRIRQNIGLDFPRALRQVLRHDPDVVAVGEIRDTETARIAIQAALTGHLIISTLHTNNSVEAYTRLVDMGIAPFHVNTTVLGILAQRLVRKTCPNCKKADPDAEQKIQNTAYEQWISSGTQFYKGTGCGECDYTGYKGRTVVYEFFEANENIKTALLKGEAAATIKEMAFSNGRKKMEETALKKAVTGVTSIDEIISLGLK